MENLISEKQIINNLIVNGFKTVILERIKFIEKRLYVMREPFKVYVGLTGSLDAATFKGDAESKRLGKWRDSMRRELGGQDMQEAFVNTMADFGTLVHESLVRIKENGKLDWKEEQEYAHKYFDNSCRMNGIIPNFNVIRRMIFDYCKAASSLMQFVYDNVVEMHSIEGMCLDDDLQIATPVDLVCKIKTKKGDIDVSLNIKTSEQFSDGHRRQVCIEKYLWNQTYPELQVAQTGLLRHKDWSMKKGLPTYELELIDLDTESKMLKGTLNRLRICRDDENSTYLGYPTEVPVFVGSTKIGDAPKVEQRTLQQLFLESTLTEELA